jgi:catalase
VEEFLSNISFPSFKSSSPNIVQLYLGAMLVAALPGLAFAQGAPRETPLSMVNALHTAFGEHHDRAVHTKGVILEGTFTPAQEAHSIVRTPIFSGGALPVVARFSVFAGVPNLPDNDDGASPAGFAVR